MSKQNEIKERMIEVTRELIEENQGDVSKITARMISQRAEVSLGLMNYHFGSKDNLITVCVQRMIDKVVNKTHEWSEKSYADDEERLKAWAIAVFEFLFDHPYISKISILGDMDAYRPDCNSIQTQFGFCHAIEEEMPENRKKLLVFMMVASMQVAFLGKDSMRDLLGYDFTEKEQREKYITDLIEILLKGEEEK